MVRKADFQSVNRGSIPRGVTMIYLKIVFKTWSIDYQTFKGRANSFSIDYGPFPSEQQARWFWLLTKEKMNRSYDIAIIYDENNNELYIDESSDVQPW